MRIFQTIDPPDDIWITRLRPGHAVYDPKKHQFMKIKYGWQPSDIELLGSIGVALILGGRSRGRSRPRHLGQTHEWRIYSNGTGFDGLPILLPVRNNCPKRHSKSINQRISRSLRKRFKKFKKKKRTVGKLTDWIGADWMTIRRWLEGQFNSGMTCKNYGIRWNIDHIRPLASFDLSDPIQAAQAWHFSNLQPMWIQDNDEKDDQRVNIDPFNGQKRELPINATHLTSL